MQNADKRSLHNRTSCLPQHDVFIPHITMMQYILRAQPAPSTSPVSQQIAHAGCCYANVTSGGETTHSIPRTVQRFPSLFYIASRLDTCACNTLSSRRRVNCCSCCCCNQFAMQAAPGSVFVSIFESGSTDQTTFWLDVLKLLLLPLRVPAVITTNGSLDTK